MIFYRACTFIMVTPTTVHNVECHKTCLATFKYWNLQYLTWGTLLVTYDRLIKTGDICILIYDLWIFMTIWYSKKIVLLAQKFTQTARQFVYHISLNCCTEEIIMCYVKRLWPVRETIPLSFSMAWKLCQLLKALFQAS
jgi:hypothetical protein